MSKTEPVLHDCPLARATRLLGDRWTLLILRDIMFGGRRTYRALLRQSPEGIASNILSARLKRMVDQGLLTRTEDPDAEGRQPYALTERAIALLPVLAELSAWALDGPPTPADIRTRLVIGGGPKLWTALQAELRDDHLRGILPDLAIQTRLWETEADVLNGLGPIDYVPDVPLAAE